MFKKMFTLLFVLAWCFTLSAQDFAEVTPNPIEPVKTHDPNLEAMWDVLLQIDVSAVSGASGNAGAEFDGSSFYTTRWASNLIHEYSITGTLIREFSVAGVTGTRDLAYDGTYFYGGSASTQIRQMDFTTNTLIGTIPSPVNVRNIAYDSDLDAFWVSDWSTNIVCVSRAGAVLHTIAPNPSISSNYGSAYDNVTPGGPYLYLFSQGTGAGTPQLIHQIQLPSGTPTGVTHDVMSDVGLGNTGAIAGGLFSMTDYATGFFTIGGLLQGVPDELFVYEIGPGGGGGGCEFEDDFESYTAGTQLCLQTTNWEPWVGSVPGSSADPFVSSAQSYSGNNSVVIVSNNDLVRRHGPKTSGKWYISFVFYIPAGKSGYFNTMNGYSPATNVWGMDSYFDVGGGGRLDTTGGGGTGSTNVLFNWTPATWNQVVVIVDLDATPPKAEYWIGTNPSNFHQVATWGWTQNGTKPNQLHVNDLYGAATTDEMYVDDFKFCDAMPPIIPVELTSFTGNVNTLGQVVLNWETATEVNNQGFEIERKTETSEFRTVGFVEGYGTTSEPRSYSFIDKTADNGINYYRLKQVDFNGTYTYSEVVEIDVTGPLTFDLAQNYPNPFNPSTNIKYSVPESGNIRLSVFNIVGEEVAVLVDGFSEAGFHEVTFNASYLSTGVYVYKLQSQNSVQTKKMMLLK